MFIKPKPITAGRIMKDLATGAVIGLAVTAPYFLMAKGNPTKKYKPAPEYSCTPSSSYEINVDGIPITAKHGKKLMVNNVEYNVTGDFNKVVLENNGKIHVLPQGKYVEMGDFKLIYIRCQD